MGKGKLTNHREIHSICPPRSAALMVPCFKLKVVLVFATILAAAAPVFAQVAKGDSENSKSIPPAGIDVPPADRAALMRDVAALADEIKALSASKDAKVKSLLPDVMVYERAVRSALENNEFF